MTYTEACERMLRLVEQDHGGCDQENCALREALEDDYSPLDAIYLWHCSGASDSEFNDLYDKWGKDLEQERQNG